ncbi:uncharacterized protein LOC127782043 [Oryza glaberrima]|nr:uncharacterized protein LOC127782043 [Oryza glaberrima]
MGCSSSRDVRGGAAKPPAVAAPAAESRRHSLRPSRTALVLTSLAFCRGRRDDAVHAYSSLPLEEPPAKGAHVSVDFDFRALPGEEDAKRGLKAALEDAAPARRCASFNASSPPPAAKEAEVRALPGFDQGIMSGLRGIVAAEPSPSPERENPTTPKASEEEAAAAAFDDMGTPAARDIPEVTGFVRARVDEFHEKIEKKKKAAKATDEEALDVAPPPPRRPERVTKASAVVVVYFTSLRGVRRTFEDGRAVRAILRGHRVRVDERDVSMHATFRAELRGLLGDGFAGPPPLPRVFVGNGRHDLGGADEVRALHEAGELARALAAAGCEQHAADAAAGACAACGDMRFLPCETCYGSCKVFAGDAVAGMFWRCPDCNENGLIRCPVCCY